VLFWRVCYYVILATAEVARPDDDTRLFCAIFSLRVSCVLFAQQRNIMRILLIREQSVAFLIVMKPNYDPDDLLFIIIY